jgi:putative spermidine/putrescine transport system ATP-binding protein
VGDTRLPSTGTIHGEVDYIIRPEKLAFADEGGIVRGRIGARVFLGQHWLYQIETPLGVVQLTEANIEAPGAAEGDDVGIIWSAEHVRVIPRGTAQ